MAIDLAKYDAVLLDLDGTVYHEDHPLPGAVQLIRALQEAGRRFACLSNSAASPLRVMDRLHLMGVDLEPDQIYTAAAAACDYVLEEYARPGRQPRVFNLATESVQEMLQGMVEWVQTAGEPCDVVLAGAPSNVYATEERQRIALQLLRRGSGTALVGLSADRVYPSPRGLEFGSGALCAMLSYAANVQPIFCGKPQPVFFMELCRRLGVSPAGCILIGDNIESDVVGAKAVGMATVLTLSGVTRRRDLQNLPPQLEPDLVVEDLSELI
ncbi:HAD-IIA family hydrolase [Fontivita pretiosa]|uniref:HAD-IIA family hydrolase n=1 Tax=Fontivita pretiosa TaxID=2989684 RepID=UPI003D175191